MDSAPGPGSGEQPFTVEWIQEVSWEFVHPFYMCLVDLKKVYDLIPWGLLVGGTLQVGLYLGPLL